MASPAPRSWPPSTPAWARASRPSATTPASAPARRCGPTRGSATSRSRTATRSTAPTTSWCSTRTCWATDTRGGPGAGRHAAAQHARAARGVRRALRRLPARHGRRDRDRPAPRHRHALRGDRQHDDRRRLRARARGSPWRSSRRPTSDLGFAEQPRGGRRRPTRRSRVREAAARRRAAARRAGDAQRRRPDVDAAHRARRQRADRHCKTGSWSTQRPALRRAPRPLQRLVPGRQRRRRLRPGARHRRRGGRRRDPRARRRRSPAVCGRVCPAPCMEGCNRGEYDGAVQHPRPRALDRRPAAGGRDGRSRSRPTRPRRVAIVGGGPAGLARRLRPGARRPPRPRSSRARQQLGGVLRTGIPAYRLPRDVLDREIAARPGARRRGALRRRSSTPPRLARAGPTTHDAVILATGLQRLRAPRGPGRGPRRACEQGIALPAPREPRGRRAPLGPRGGARRRQHRHGLRAQRAARRRRARDRRLPPHARGDAGHPRGDRRGRGRRASSCSLQRQPVALPRQRTRRRRSSSPRSSWASPTRAAAGGPSSPTGRTTLACDHVLLALGPVGRPRRSCPTGWELQRGRASANGERAANVFAAGDLATGDGTVTHAIGSGRRAGGAGPARRWARTSRCSSAPTARRGRAGHRHPPRSLRAAASRRGSAAAIGRRAACATSREVNQRPRGRRARRTAASRAATAPTATPAWSTARRASSAADAAATTRWTTPTARAAASASTECPRERHGDGRRHDASS